MPRHRFLVALPLLAGCTAQPAENTALPPEGGLARYTGEVTVDPESGGLDGTWTVRFAATSEMAEGASFLLNGRLELTTLTGDGVASWERSAWSDGSDWDQVDVTWAEAPEPGEVRELRFDYHGTPFDSAGAHDRINSIGPTWIELGLDSGWPPVFADLDHALTGELTLRLPGEWTVAASGDVTRLDDGYRIVNTVPLVDFAFAAGRKLRVDGTDRAAVYHEGAPAATIDKVVEAATTCRTWLDERYGELPDLTFVLAPRDDSGYARKNYIVLTRVDDYPMPDLSRFVCHELAHYWSSAPSADAPDYWMTEAFAELVSARHVRDVYGDSAYEAIVAQWRGQADGLPPVWTDTSSARPPFGVSYRKAPLVLTEFGASIGEETFAEVLGRYMTEETATTPQLLGQVEEVGGPAARARLEAMLGR